MADTSLTFPVPPAVTGIVGLGYVGLPLMLAFVEAGHRVIGFDIDPAKTAQLRAGKSYIKHVPHARIAEAVASGRLDATTDFSRVSETSAVIICVPTPLDEHLHPNLSYVRDTLDTVCPHLKCGHIICLESTSYPGTTDEYVVPRVKARGLEPGKDVFVVYSPEREDPGNPYFTAARIPKVVGGVTQACLDAGVQLYEMAFDKVVPVSSCMVAECTKLLENIYRAVNIGLVNELKTVADAMGIDIWEVIRAASTKPFGFAPFYPGPGLGGHCIPVDPFYLKWKAREYGVDTPLIELAGQVNRRMPEYVVRRTSMALNDRGKAVKDSNILLLGLAYKADVDDMRESPTFALLDRFADLGAHVSYYDPHVPQIRPTREHARWRGVASTAWCREVVERQDAVVIVTNHKAMDWKSLAIWATLIIDTRNAMHGISGSAQVVKA